jgi:Raf kinase inhibitor-like YbhB/YbcL family protein
LTDRSRRLPAAALGLCLALVGCESASVDPSVSPGASASVAESADGNASGFVLTSPAFADGEPIPVEYTCDGEELSPPLAWSGAPEETAAYALIEEDPDANGFVHWVVVNIPPDWTEIEEGASWPIGGDPIEGANGSGEVGYAGSCPPNGTHTYVFTLYALTEPAPVDVEPSQLTAASVRELISGILAGQAVLTGTYAR